ncbi:YsnF/AvaK domain-containing protein, partial [Klebsiella pneumoniae]|uniref:YsnF/AvaK domain-containing protein n=1 Tax=Klebsiella pneumoniae TaxID=573 RepID=UPI001156356D
TGPVDDAMTRSEEQVRAGTTTQETGRVRLRKYIETETVTKSVPVSHEEARLVHEPITPENYDRSVDGPDITEAVHEVTLNAEVPVVEKEVVPVERIRLDTETVTEQQTVSTDVRKEQIELDDATTATGQV